MLTGEISCKKSLEVKLIKLAGGSGVKPPTENNYFIATMGYPTSDAIVTETTSGSITGLELDALSFDGTQYINIGYNPTNNTRIDIVFTQEQYATFLFGCRTGANSSDAFAFAAYSTSMYPQFGSFQSVVMSSMSLNVRHRIVLSQDGATIDGLTVKTFDDMNFTSSLDLYIGTRNQNGTLDSRMFVGQIHAVKIYENNMLQMALYPYNNGTTDGLYDIISGTFYAQSIRASTNSTASLMSAKPMLSDDIDLGKMQGVTIGDTVSEEEII